MKALTRWECLAMALGCAFALATVPTLAEALYAGHWLRALQLGAIVTAFVVFVSPRGE